MREGIDSMVREARRRGGPACSQAHGCPPAALRRSALARLPTSLLWNDMGAALPSASSGSADSTTS
jgi:hypothetical protein